MNKYFIWMLVGVLLILNGLLLWKTREYRLNNIILSQSVRELGRKNQNLLGFNLHVLKDQYESCGLPLNNNQFLINSQGDTVSLKKLVRQGPKLVYNFRNINCRVCIDDELERLSHTITEIGKNNILLILKYRTLREMYVLENQLGLPLFDVPACGFNLPIDKKIHPYIFIIDSNYSAKDLFIPTKSNPLLGELYFESVVPKYWKPNKK